MSNDRGNVIYAVSWVLFAVSFVLVLLRIWTRTRIIRSWGWDDASICLAMVGNSRINLPIDTDSGPSGLRDPQHRHVHR